MIRFVCTAAKVMVALPVLFVVFVCFVWGSCSGEKRFLD